MANRISRDPDFAQTIYDALYYPTHRWYLGHDTIDCSADKLLDGMAELSGDSIEMPEPDQDFLEAQVRTVLDLVVEPARLESALRAAAEANLG